MSQAIIRSKIDNSFLRRALKNFAIAYPVARAKAFEGIDFAALRRRIAERKRSGLQRLPELIAQFRASAEAHGAVVHLCRTPEEANRAIYGIIRGKGADFLVKSKAMTSEEIELNHYLEARGVRCLETDLGEWIIQLAGERPSHMVMPAIHKNKEEVAELFAKATGRDCPPDIPTLVQVARETLRSGFLEGQVGMSGANVAIAENGTLALVTNEGNARLVTTLPKTHIALVGVEKIVASLSEGLDILNILPKNATGQKITSYLSFIQGPSPGDGRELHIVLLDNGRVELAADPAFGSALQCVKCGACANVCPIYEIVGGHVFGHIYVGGIGLILTPFLHGFDKAEEILKLCIGCRKCNEVCAAEIDIEGLIVDLRDKIKKPFGQKFLFATMLKNRKLMHATLRAAWLAQKPLQGEGGRIRHLPLVFDSAAAGKSLPPIAAQPYRDSVSERPFAAKADRVLFYSGCLADFVYPELCRDASDSLSALGYEVVFPQQQSCCGIPARYSGEMAVARDLAKTNIDVLLASDADYVATICPTCTMSLTHDFPKLLADDPVYRDKAARLAAMTLNYSELAARKIADSGNEALISRSGQGGQEEATQAYQSVRRGADDAANAGMDVKAKPTVTYHDACHLKRGCGVSAQPRQVLRELAGVEISEMADCDKCCGFGGSYSLKYPEISREVLKNKLDSIAATGVTTVAVDCPGCKLQIEGGLEAAGSSVVVEHSATLVARRLREPG